MTRKVIYCRNPERWEEINELLKSLGYYWKNGSPGVEPFIPAYVESFPYLVINDAGKGYILIRLRTNDLKDDEQIYTISQFISEYGINAELEEALKIIYND